MNAALTKRGEATPPTFAGAGLTNSGRARSMSNASNKGERSMRFVRLTSWEDEPLVVNVGQIATLMPLTGEDRPGTKLLIAGGAEYQVKEGLPQILQLIGASSSAKSVARPGVAEANSSARRPKPTSAT
jgi:hypothetical protein